MKAKTEELKSRALDWAVAKIVSPDLIEIVRDRRRGAVVKIYPTIEPPGAHSGPAYALPPIFEPSTNWAQGGPLIEQREMRLGCCAPQWIAKTEIVIRKSGEPIRTGEFICVGATPLQAAMRVVVLSSLGEWVDVPDELMGV